MYIALLWAIFVCYLNNLDMANRDSASTSSLHLYFGLLIDVFVGLRANIEPTAGTINDICAFSGSGLMLLALDCGQIPSYFLPALGPAPKWCSYLENLTVCFSYVI